MSGAAPAGTRTLGRSGVPITRLGLGTAALGGLYTPVDDETAAATIRSAWDAGLRYFDTAPHYGLGLAERRLGEALRDRPRDAYTLSTKVGRLLEPLELKVPNGGFGDLGDLGDLPHGFAGPATHRRVWDFSADGVRRSLEASLTRLGLDRVDLALLHDPDDHGEQAFREAYPALERLRAEGTVRAIGAGMNQSAMLTRFVTDTDVDAVLCAGRYTLLEQPALHDLLPAAQARGKSVIIGGVYNSGLLAAPTPEAPYNYARAPAELLARAHRIRTVTEAHGIPLRTAALAFPFGHAAVTGVLLGPRTPAELQDATTRLRTSIPDHLWASLRSEGLLTPAAPTPAPTGARP